MDDYRFVNEVLRYHLASLEAHLDIVGRQYPHMRDFGVRILQMIRSDRRHARQDVDPTDDEQERLGTSLLQGVITKTMLARGLLRELLPREEIQLPLGFRYLVWDTAELVLRDHIGQAAPLILRPDPLKGYSSVLLRDSQSWMANVLPAAASGGTLTRSTLVVGLPLVDPANVLIAPIIAHELSHSLIDYDPVKTFISELIEESTGAISPRARKVMKLSTSDWAAAKNDISRWVPELFCDILAAVVVGPAYLFAAAVYLQRPSSDDYSPTHPPTADRLKTIVHTLDAVGWTGVLENKAKAQMTYLSNLTRATSSDNLRPATAVFAGLNGELTEKLLSFARTYGEDIELSPGAYLDVQARHELERSFQLELIPPGLAEDPPSVWTLVNAAWLSQLTRTKLPAAIPRIAGNSHFCSYVTKSLELSNLARLWSDDVNSNT